jgi:nicotinamidase-related amidase
MATSFGVESTARAAYDLGFHVVLAVDAMTYITQDAHDHAASWTFPILGRTSRTDDPSGVPSHRDAAEVTGS